jgi:hypothetical protein
MTEANSTLASQRAASVRTALSLAVVALVFFSGIILGQCFGLSTIGLGVLGVAVVGFQLAAMMSGGRAR